MPSFIETYRIDHAARRVSPTAILTPDVSNADAPMTKGGEIKDRRVPEGRCEGLSHEAVEATSASMSRGIKFSKIHLRAVDTVGKGDFLIKIKRS